MVNSSVWRRQAIISIGGALTAIVSSFAIGHFWGNVTGRDWVDLLFWSGAGVVCLGGAVAWGGQEGSYVHSGQQEYDGAVGTVSYQDWVYANQALVAGVSFALPGIISIIAALVLAFI